ncbi:NAD-dependent epimerase/dehydratase family protein [Peribacillus sp. SCS-26]|uniref:NAD-dependent epimerase/dehydratase family protein n=1 Tax=Paraperibacillus marinus TaxID=3115295 RepID=UPI003905FA6A
MTKVLVLGGTRFFGKKLVSLLLDEGSEVTIVTRGITEDSFGNRVKRIRADRTIPEELEKAAAGNVYDIIYDNICYTDKDALEASRIFEGRVKKYIFTSSLSVYEFGPDRKKEGDFDPYSYKLEPADEDGITYGEGKRRAEAVFYQQTRFPVNAVRFPIVLGLDDYTKRLHFHIENMKKDMAVGVPNREALLSFIHSDEAARFLLWLGKSGLDGPVNACSDGETSLSSLFDLLEEATGKEALIQPITKEEQMSPFGVSESWYMDNSKAKNAGFEFDDLHEWLPALIGELSKD